jgi:hypothetical protein
MKKKLIIVGTGLFPEVARCYFDELSEYEVIGFACHQQYMQSDTIYGLPLYAVEDLKDIQPPSCVTLFVGIGYKQMNKMRQRVYLELANILTYPLEQQPIPKKSFFLSFMLRPGTL